MGFRQMNAVGARHFPDEGDGVEPDNPQSLVDQEAQNSNVLDQQAGIGEVHVDLVMGEGAPDIAQPCRRFDRVEKRVRAWPDDLAQVVALIGVLDEAVAG